MAVTAGYLYKAEIVVDHNKVSGSGDLTDFPILISGTYDGTGGEPDLRVTGSGGDVTSSSGYDIEFSSDSDGNNKLAHELCYYSSTTGEIVAHVKVPTLDGDANTTIYMWFGNSSVTVSTEQVTSVWDSDYIGVWHMFDASGGLIDSTSYNNDLLNERGSAGTINYRAAGKIKYAVDFPGTKGLGFTPANGSSITALNGLTTSVTGVTVEGLGNTDVMGTNGLYTFFAQTPEVELSLRFQNGYGVSNGGWFYVKASSGTWDASLDGVVSTSTWYHLAGRATRGATTDIFLNGSKTVGESIDSNPFSGSSAYASAAIGYFVSGNAQGFDGKLQEIRVSKVARSDDWVITTHNNLMDNSSFYTMGDSESTGDAGSPSVSPSSSASPSISPSSSASPSISPSSSQSPSISPSSSTSPSEEALTEGTVVWGQESDWTGTYDNVLTFDGNWSGTGAIMGLSDAEFIQLQSGEYMISNVVNTGLESIRLKQNQFIQGGNDVQIQWRTGASKAACESASWTTYTDKFDSEGFVQVRLNATI